MASFREIAFQFSGEAQPLIKSLRDIADHVRKVPDGKKIHIEAKTEIARQELNHLEDKLEELDAKSPNIRVTATIKDLVAKIALGRQILASLPNDKVVDIKVRENFSRGLARVESIVAGITRDTEKLGNDVSRGFQAATPASLGFSGIMSKLSVGLRRIPPLLQGIAVVTISTLIPAIIALTAAIGGAVVAVAALGAALAAAAGPAVAVFIGVFTSISKVLQVRQLRQQSLDSATRRGASVQRQATAADEARHKAGIALRDSHEQLRAAEEALAQAREQAAQQIADNRDAALEAARAVTDAQHSLAEATIQANRNMQDSFNAVIDAQSRLAHSRIDLSRQKLNLKDDEAELKKLREGLGLAGSSLDDTFKKFQDVHVDTSGIAKALEGAGASDVKGEDARKIQEQLLKIKEDHLDIKDSVQAEKEAQQQANRAQQDANKFRRLGIAADDGYRSALEAVATAQRASKKANDALNKSLKEGVNGNPAVLAASRNLRDARQREEEATKTYHDKLKKISKGQTDAGGSADLYRKKLEQLTGSQRKLLGAIDFLVGAYKFALKPAVDSVLGGMASALRSVSFAAILFRGDLKGVGDAWGEEIRKMGHFVLRPDNLFAFHDFAKASATLTHTFGDSLRSLFGLIINVAQAAMPLLLDEASKIKDAFGSWEAGTDNTKKVHDALVPAVKVLNLFIEGAIQVGRAIFGVFEGGNKQIISFVKFLVDGIKGFADFANSASGQKKIAKFFKDTLPFVKTFIKLVVALGKTIAIALEIIFPILEPILKALLTAVNIFNTLLGVVNTLLGPFKGLVGFLISMAIAGGIANKILKGLELVFGALDFVIGIALRAILDFGEKLLGPFKTAIPAAGRLLAKFGRAIATAFRAIVGTVGRVLGPVFDVILRPFRAAWKAVSGVIKAAFNPIVGVVRAVIRGIGDALGKLSDFAKTAGHAAGRIGSGIKDAFRGVVGFVGRIFDRLLGVIKGGINTAVIGPLNAIIHALNKIHFKVPGFVPGLGGKGFGLHFGDIPKLAGGGLTLGSTFAQIGEGGNQEAVLPLTRGVFEKLGQGIVSAMKVSSGGAVRGAALGGLTGGSGGFTQVDVHLPPAPAAAVPDARYQAVQLGNDLRRRAGGAGGLT
jgi:phage-related protein